MAEATQPRPFAQRLPFFYGWVVVLGAFLGSFAGGGMQSFTFGVFIKPMTESLGWSRSALIAAMTMRNLVTAGVSPVFGPYVDRRGPRLLMVMSAISGGLACLWLTRVTELWELYAAFILVGLAGGTGLGGVVAGATVMKWFIRLRGRATAFSTMGNTAAGALLAPLMGFIILKYSWQAGWLALAGVFFFLLLPVCFFMVRQPEDIGLLPDGAKSPEEVQSVVRHRSGRSSEHSWRLREALRTRALWLLTASVTIGGVGVASVVVHEYSFITDQGYSVAVAGAVLSTHAILASVGRLVWGFLVERYPVRYCMAVLYLGCALGLGILLLADSVAMLFAFAVVYGICVGGHIVLSNVAWADYFGREFVGTIRGVLTPVTAGATALGPVLAGLAYDLQKSYMMAFLALLGAFLLGVAFVLAAKPPVRQEASAASQGTPS